MLDLAVRTLSVPSPMRFASGVVISLLPGLSRSSASATQYSRSPRCGTLEIRMVLMPLRTLTWPRTQSSGFDKFKSSDGGRRDSCDSDLEVDPVDESELSGSNTQSSPPGFSASFGINTNCLRGLVLIFTSTNIPRTRAGSPPFPSSLIDMPLRRTSLGFSTVIRTGTVRLWVSSPIPS